MPALEDWHIMHLQNQVAQAVNNLEKGMTVEEHTYSLNVH